MNDAEGVHVRGRRALGEFLLVMVGVLAALAVDSWYAERQDRRAASEHIDAVFAELQANLRLVEVTLSRLDTVQQQIRILLEASQGVSDQLPADSLSELTWDVFYPTVFEPLTSAYENLVGTEGYRLLEDPQLRQDLTEVAGKIEEYRRVDWQWTQWNFVTQPYINTNLHGLDWAPASWRAEQGLPAPRTRTDWDAVLSDQEFEGILVNRFISAHDSRNLLEPLRDNVQALLDRYEP